MSPLLLKNSNAPCAPGAIQVTPEVRTLRTPILEDYGDDQVQWRTPRKACDYVAQAREFARIIKAMPRDRLFLRKVGKALDKQAFELAISKRKIESLEHCLEEMRARKRKKVQEDPNTTFANIQTIRKAQKAVGRPTEDVEDTEEAEDSEDIEDCIEVL